MFDNFVTKQDLEAAVARTERNRVYLESLKDDPDFQIDFYLYPELKGVKNENFGK